MILGNFQELSKSNMKNDYIEGELKYWRRLSKLRLPIALQCGIKSYYRNLRKLFLDIRQVGAKY